jgi:hypothetical protein
MKVNKFGAEDECIKVYNPLEKKVIAVYSNPNKASNRLGISSSVIVNRCITKERIFSPLLNMEIAIRKSVKTEAEEELIIETLKKRIL